MSNSLMKKYRPQMILLFIIVIEALIMIGLVQYRSYIVKKQEEEAANSQTQHSSAAMQENHTTDSAGRPAPEEITTLDNIPVRDKNAGENTYTKDGARIVCLDPALGGYEKGNTSETPAAMTESEYNLEFAELIKKELNSQNVVVYMTREENKYVEDTERSDLANNVYADLMITLTRASYNGIDERSGITAWVHRKRPNTSDAAAKLILHELEAAGAEINVVDAGTAKSTEEDYYTNSQCIGPSLVLGMGSVLNRSDIRDYEENKEAYAKAVAKAIVQWMDNQGL